MVYFSPMWYIYHQLAVSPSLSVQLSLLHHGIESDKAAPFKVIAMLITERKKAMYQKM